MLLPGEQEISDRRVLHTSGLAFIDHGRRQRSGGRHGLGEHSGHQPARHGGRNDCIHDPVDPARDDELDEFLEVASAALPRITEIIVAFPAEHRAGAPNVATGKRRGILVVPKRIPSVGSLQSCVNCGR
jgi:hypothetical protein